MLLLVVLYAAFDHGAAGVAAGARIQTALAALAALACGGLLWTGSLRFAAPRAAVVGLALLVAFACWSGVTVAWSVAPDQTWLELNRAITYVLVLALAIVVGASHGRSIELAAKGFVAVALALAVYGIGQKVIPGVHIPGVFTLDQTAVFPRLQAPFGYWNALALFIAMGIPIALAGAVDQAMGRRVRLAAVLAVQLLLVTLDADRIAGRDGCGCDRAGGRDRTQRREVALADVVRARAARGAAHARDRALRAQPQHRFDCRYPPASRQAQCSERCCSSRWS